MRYSMLLLVPLVALGCATQPEIFRPGERTNATSPEGFLAAEYPLRDESGQIGEVTVWSDGAERRDGATVIHVAFDIENLSSAPLRFEQDELGLDSATFDDAVLRGLEPAFVQGETTIAPGTSSTVSALFILPASIRPQEVDAFRVHWRVSGAADYAQITPFYEDETPRLAAGPYYWDTPFFDPFLYDPFYWSGAGAFGPTF